MKVNPYQYENERKNKARNDESEERTRSSSRQKAIYSEISNTVNVGSWSNGCGTIGLVVGFFACCSMCTDDAAGAGFATWVALSIGGMILGAILAGLINAGHYSGVKNAEKKVAKEQSRCETAIQHIHTQAEQEIVAYKTEFENEAQKMSVKYAESALATEVINWMTDGFGRTIEATDRRGHIEMINVPFSFNVYADKITCNLGTYDFEINRCANLTNPLQQTAIARAIATAIQLNITMKYPNDISGTDFVLNISYSYAEDHVSVAIIYTAPNGNYRSVKSW